ncbi:MULTISPECIES: hypothetical protein [unclassified Streptomyces]|uniref:hypothetical protein n=1 Tax=unclassified Streptomyces TaxID=2593676 RepID=UPI00136B3114|nr:MULTISPECIES: hypothetical protein [unclassified Streptomyces]NEA02330.1 hypothetical protein [Streptomyces sp. SID10116]MYY85673.1 hypothetical protein [Streptomyces sp. SID335]MYZ15587.1 hypothetical protein [Streptomyces sp. SID337]NDZ85821.1 hypothetical protein [Streptomyces sp. SID10115]NEB45364.1 hypothetical protein [Streptomyces sp. SID339]
MAQVVTEDEQAAQRRVGSAVRSDSVLTGGGLAMWREYRTGPWTLSAAELSRDMDVLKVPHTIVVAFRPPRGRDEAPRKGQEVRVPFPDLDRLVRWMPQLRQQIDEIPDAHFGFPFPYCEARPTGMVMKLLPSLAAEWPTWTAEQAAAMGLLCARCGFDLRTRGVEQRLAHDIGGEPGRPRLECGPCRGDGLSALSGPPHDHVP